MLLDWGFVAAGQGAFRAVSEVCREGVAASVLALLDGGDICV